MEHARPTGMPSDDELSRMHEWWLAANYLSVGQVYLLDNPLLKERLAREHVKPRLLGHWGTVPGLNFLYVHLNRVIRARDLSVIFIAGPGHGAPGVVANTWLEGTYSELYPEVMQDEEGMRHLFRQFSFPGGIPSHAAPETPGSIHEGGELGYSLSHAYGAVLDNPDLIAACVVGDGEAETGPLATAWHANKFLDPASDGAVLPILHLNGYKIANPTVLARIPHDELDALLRGYGYAPHFVEGDEPQAMHRKMAATLDRVMDEIGAIQERARSGNGTGERARWPMIVLRSPKGWTGPKEVDGLKTEGSWRSHQVPFTMEKPEHLGLLETMAAQLPAGGAVHAGRRAPPGPRGARARGQPAHERQSARQWRHADAAAAHARFPRLRGEGGVARARDGRGDARARQVPARRHARERAHAQLPHLRPGRDRVEPLAGCVRGDRPRLGCGERSTATTISRRMAG